MFTTRNAIRLALVATAMMHNGCLSTEHMVRNQNDHTGYYFDDRGYKSRVCLQNIDWNDTSWYCGGAI